MSSQQAWRWALSQSLGDGFPGVEAEALDGELNCHMGECLLYGGSGIRGGGGAVALE